MVAGHLASEIGWLGCAECNAGGSFCLSGLYTTATSVLEESILPVSLHSI